MRDIIIHLVCKYYPSSMYRHLVSPVLLVQKLLGFGWILTVFGSRKPFKAVDEDSVPHTACVLVNMALEIIRTYFHHSTLKPL